jgi:hypothetical protein
MSHSGQVTRGSRRGTLARFPIRPMALAAIARYRSSTVPPNLPSGASPSYNDRASGPPTLERGSGAGAADRTAGRSPVNSLTGARVGAAGCRAAAALRTGRSLLARGRGGPALTSAVGPERDDRWSHAGAADRHLQPRGTGKRRPLFAAGCGGPAPTSAPHPPERRLLLAGGCGGPAPTSAGDPAVPGCGTRVLMAAPGAVTAHGGASGDVHVLRFHYKVGARRTDSSTIGPSPGRTAAPPRGVQ